MVTGHKVDERNTDWNKYIHLSKRVIIANPETGPKLEPSSLRNLRLKKQKLEPEAKYIQPFPARPKLRKIRKSFNIISKR